MRRRFAARSGAALAIALAAPAAAWSADPSGTAPAAPAPASALAAAPGPSGSDLAVRARALSDEAVSRWASIQLPDGRFPDPVAGNGGDYGTAMLGYAMLRRGAAQADKGLLRGGLDALTAQVDQPAGGAFELLVLARAYRWANGALPGDPVGGPLWEKAGPKIAADLARRGAVTAPVTAKCYADARCYNNLKLVSSLASVELLATGLQAQSPTALLADPGLLGRVLHRAGSRVPKEVGADLSRVGGAGTTGAGMLSDPPRNPLAYHALSTMMLGELLSALGPDAPAATERAFQRAAVGLLLLAAPDGDLSWFGRGQGQVWVPAVVADAAAQAAKRTTSSQLRGRFLALAEASLTRLRSVYGVGTNGFPLVPGAIDGPTLSARKIDSYATTRGYNGLAVDALDRAAATLETIPAPATATRVPSTRQGVVRSPSQAGLATITRGPLWIAIAARSRAEEDARYSSGLLAMQRRDDAGRWASILPGRALSPRIGGTLAVRSGGKLFVPSGVISKAGGAGAAVVVGGWARPGQPAPLLDAGTRWTWSIAADGSVEARFRAKSARTVVASGLVGDGARVGRTPFGFVVTQPDGGALRYSLGVAGRRLPLARATREAGASAYDARLSVAQVWAPVRRGEEVVLKIRVSAPPTVSLTGGG